MMRLPARLTAKLAKTRITQVFRSVPARPLIHCVDPTEVLHPGAAAPVSCEKMHRLIENPAPVIWISGSETLIHPGIGHFIRAIQRNRHIVFLESSGTFLRRRIHEFQPGPELFLTVAIDSPQTPEFVLALEGLRAARLSGFFTVVHSLVRGDSDLAHLHNLRPLLLEKDVDGWLITSGSAGEDVAPVAAEARGLIPHTFWRQFSEDVEEALLSQAQSRELRIATTAVAETPRTETYEEGARLA